MATGFLEVGLSALIDSGMVVLEGSLLAVFTRLCMQSGENVISGMIYALLGVSAMTRVGHAQFCSLIIITVKFYQSSTPCSVDLSNLNKVV